MIQAAFNAKLESSSYKIALDDTKFSGIQHLTSKLHHGVAELCSHGRKPSAGVCRQGIQQMEKASINAGKK